MRRFGKLKCDERRNNFTTLEKGAWNDGVLYNDLERTCVGARPTYGSMFQGCVEANLGVGWSATTHKGPR